MSENYNMTYFSKSLHEIPWHLPPFRISLTFFQIPWPWKKKFSLTFPWRVATLLEKPPTPTPSKSGWQMVIFANGKECSVKKTRRSENDNTPQPLDQWTNSSFIGQQVGNCKSFTLTHYFADLSAMHRGRRSIPLCIQHHIQLTSLSFQVSQTSHCWVTAISIFYLENPRSRSWVRSKFEVTMWV